MRKKIAKLMELPTGSAKRFSFKRDGLRIDAFIANFNGDIVAYENLCRHLPITLDYGDGEFFSKDNNLFVCQTHGAFMNQKLAYALLVHVLELALYLLRQSWLMVRYFWLDRLGKFNYRALAAISLRIKAPSK